MSRRSPRVRARLTATVLTEGGAPAFVCQTRDVSREGCYLDTVQWLDPGVRVEVSLMDLDRGVAIELRGVVMRAPSPQPDGSGRGVGVGFDDPPDDWVALVERLALGARRSSTPTTTGRLRVLVVGQDQRQRGALALYVTSGWDVRFATDLDGVREALEAAAIDAVIAEHALDDEAWRATLSAARAAQPGARRIVRAPLAGKPPPDRDLRPDALAHCVVDVDAGLQALVDALTADLTTPAPPHA